VLKYVNENLKFINNRQIMNIALNKTDSANATITIEVEKADYVKEVENSLKDLRRNAVLPGFRKGMAPPEFLRQKYGKSILIEEVNKLVSQKLSDYINDNNLNLLGEPLPAEGHEPIDFDTQENFSLTFDVGLSPELDVNLTKDDKLPYYRIQVSEDLMNKQIEQFKSQFGDDEPAEIVEGKDLVGGSIVELDENGEPKADGITNDDALLMPYYMKDEEEKAKFMNAALNSVIVFNPHKAYEGNESELASFLKVKKEEVKNHTGDFSFTINRISRFKPAELNQNLFDKVFGPGTVDSEAAFMEKVKEGLALQLAPESDYKFILDARKLLEEKASGVQFPEAFLKRWMLESDKLRKPESLDEDYLKIISDLKFHLIKEHLFDVNGISIEEGEVQEYAKRTARAQFAQYGMPNVDDELLENYSLKMLEKKETYQSLGDKVFEDKLIKVLKEQVTLEPQEITMEEFHKLITE